MSIKERLVTVPEQWDLLRHPFYKSWNAGTLPVEALRVYAREYGELIALLPLGWETLQDQETADEEREHLALWQGFAAALGPATVTTPIPQAQALAQTARKLFASPASALGALYAFEAQQPATAQSKLQGLQIHYGLTGEPYFQAHSSNWHESLKILGRLEQLTPAEQQEARLACEQMAWALWDALSGIHTATSMN